jgi:hypothetical protein
MRAEPVMKAGGETQVTKAEKVKTRHALRDSIAIQTRIREDQSALGISAIVQCSAPVANNGTGVAIRSCGKNVGTPTFAFFPQKNGFK